MNNALNLLIVKHGFQAVGISFFLDSTAIIYKAVDLYSIHKRKL